MLGGFAKATATSTESGRRYSIRIRVHSTGIYNLVRGKRTEEYRSKGTVRKGKYYSQLFAVEKWANGKHILTEYHFDYRKHKIFRHFRQWEIKGNTLSEDVKDTMKYFGHDDFLTVMHNAIRGEAKTSGRRKTIMVAGAENSNGRVPVYVSNDPARLKRWGADAKGTLVQVGITKGIFNGGKGSITALLDGQGHPTKMIIKKVKIVGTVTVKPTKK